MVYNRIVKEEFVHLHKNQSNSNVRFLFLFIPIFVFFAVLLLLSQNRPRIEAARTLTPSVLGEEVELNINK